MPSIEKPVDVHSESNKDLGPTSDSAENTTFQSYTKVQNESHNTTAIEAQVNLTSDNDNLKGQGTHVAQNAKAAGNERSNDDGLKEDLPTEHGGQSGPEPTRYGDWEKKGRCTDF